MTFVPPFEVSGTAIAPYSEIFWIRYWYSSKFIATISWQWNLLIIWLTADEVYYKYLET